MKKSFQIIGIPLSLIGIGLIIYSCGGSSSSSATFPSGLAVSSPTAASATSASSLTKMSRVFPASDAKYSDKVAALTKLLDATKIEDCAFTLDLNAGSAGSPSCYGPSLDYQNHPDGSPTSANFPGGDLGIWTENQTTGSVTEACAAAQLNYKVNSISAQVDTAIFAAAAVTCVMKVNGTSAPAAVGDTVDVTTAMKDAFNSIGVSLILSAVTVTRSADTSDGNKVYITSIEGSSELKTLKVRLKHIPTTSNNSTYKGKLSYTIANADGTKPGNCGGGSATGQTDAVSISYEKTSETALNYQLNSGNFCGNDADPYVSSTNFTVDPTKKHTTVSGGKGWANNFNIAVFNTNPSDSTGNYQFAWQAGANDNNTRAFNASLTSTSGVVGGCAYYGYGKDISEGVAAAAIDRMICAWTGPGGGNHTGVTKAQRQCITLNSSTGVFTSDASQLAITYSPNISCNGDGSFQYRAAGTGGSFTPFPTTNNLIDLSTITDLTTPTAPTDVDL